MKEPNLNRTLYPLTTSQELLKFADSFNLFAKWQNIASIMDLDQEIDADLMLQAMQITMMRTPSAKIRLCKTSHGELKQYFSEELPTGIELVDLSELSDEEREKELEKWAQIPFEKKTLNTQLYRLKLVRRIGGMYSIYICVNHMAFDSYTIMTMVTYLMQVYLALLNKEPLPPEMGSPIDMYQADYSYKEKPAYERDLKYWNDYFDPQDEPFFTSLYGKDGPMNRKGKRNGLAVMPFRNKTLHKNLSIPREIALNCKRVADEWKVSTQSIYLAAVHTYLSTICESDDVMTINAVARRATLVQKRGGGTMVNSVFIRTKMEREKTTYREACKNVYTALNESYRHADADHGQTVRLASKAYHIPQTQHYTGLSFCFQPYFDLDNTNVSFHFHRLNNGAGAMSLYMTIMPNDASGNLTVNYEYIKAYYTTEVIEKLHAFLLKFLKEAISDPDESILTLAKRCL